MQKLNLSIHQATHEFTCSANWVATSNEETRKNTYYYRALLNDSYYCVSIGKVCYMFTMEQVRALKEKVKASKKIKYFFIVKKVDDGIFAIIPKRKIRRKM